MIPNRAYSYRQIVQIAYPILASLVMEQLIGMTDTAFLGRVGEVELGASALGGIFYMSIFMVAFGFSIGAQILIGRRNGEREYARIGSIFYQGVYFLVFLAALLFLASRALAAPILDRIIESPEVRGATEAYIRWRLYGFFFSFVAVMFRAFYVGTTQTRTLVWNSLAMVLSNVLFNYVLIFGKLGFPALGIEGAAIASSLAEMVSVLFFVLYTWRRVDARKYGLDRLSGFRPAILRGVLGVGVWTMIQNFLSMATWFFFFIAVEHLGERPLAITNLVRSVSAIPFMVMMAFSSTCSTLVSNLIGAGRIDSVRSTITQSIRITYLCVAPLVLLMALVPALILRIYTDSETLIHASLPSMWVLCSSYLFTVPALICFQAVSGTGNTRTALVLEAATLTVYALYVWLLIFRLRVDVALCWTTEHLYHIVILLLSYLYLRWGRWQDRRL